MLAKACYLRAFEFFKNISSKKEKRGASKIKSSTENLTRVVYKSFILELFILILALYSYCGDKKIKYGLLSNHLFQRAQKHSNWRDLRVSINFYKKTMPSTDWRKGFLQLLLLKFKSFSDKVKKLVVYLACITLLWISREDKTKLILFMRNELAFLYVDSYFDVPNVLIYLEK